jgi:hypothetical protein
MSALTPCLEDEVERLAVETGRSLDEIRQIALEVEAETDCLIRECLRRFGGLNWIWVVYEAARREGQNGEIWWREFLKRRRERAWR